MSERVTVPIIGSGDNGDEYRPDYDGGFDNAEYDFEAGEVTITPR